MAKTRREALKLLGFGAGGSLVAEGNNATPCEPVGKDFAVGGYRLMGRQPGYAVSVLSEKQYGRMSFDDSPTITCFCADDWEVWFVRVPKGLEAKGREQSQ